MKKIVYNKISIQLVCLGFFILFSLQNPLLGKDGKWDTEKEEKLELFGSNTELFSNNNAEISASYNTTEPEILMYSGMEGETLNGSPANPDDPDAPLDEKIYLLTMLAIVYGYILKTKQLKNNHLNRLDL